MEVDGAVPGDQTGELADLIDGSIGEASMFHESFGVYGQGVSIEVALLPPGWRDRLVRYETPGTGGVVARCLELHDLWVSKALAGRPKDLEFCRALLESGHVRPEELRSRLADVEGVEETRVGLARALLG